MTFPLFFGVINILRYHLLRNVSQIQSIRNYLLIQLILCYYLLPTQFFMGRSLA